MNLVIKNILILIVASTSSILNAQVDSTMLTVRTNVNSAGLFIDDKLSGVGKTIQVQVDSGIHLIQIVEDLKKWNAEIIYDTIIVKANDELILTYNFKSQVLLNTKPQDVYVFEKDSLIGFTPILLKEGYVDLKLEKPDYKSIYVTQNEISDDKIPELQFTGQPTDQQFYGSIMFYTLLGTAIALGVTTAYNKLKADDLYEEYKITGDKGLIDNIEHYDDQSAWTLIATELCIGAIIYFFLAE